MDILPKEFYTKNEVVSQAESLLGAIIRTNYHGVVTEGVITETEAYRGRDDKASHAFGMNKTKRTSTMFREGGVAYIYLCYGIHHLFNIVCGPEGEPNGVLIRAVEPLQGMEHMLERRNMNKIRPALTAGPGRLTQALGITTREKGIPVYKESKITIFKPRFSINTEDIVRTKRVGIDYAEESKNLPWRFYYRKSSYISVL